MPAKLLAILMCITIPLAGIKSQDKNIVIYDQAHVNEPSVMIHPDNPAVLVAGSNLNLVYYSYDTGKTWTVQKLTSPYNVWGDPCLIVDDSGHFYYFHLSNPENGAWIDRIVCQKSRDGGQTWSQGSFIGLNGEKKQDKEWAIFDRKTKTIYVSWTQFDVYAPVTRPKETDSSVILFSMSKDYGKTWTTPIRISQFAGDCWDSDSTTEGAIPAVGPDGEVYIVWAAFEKIWFDRSLDGGKTWLAKDKVIASQPGGWDYDVPRIYRCNGLPVVVCDTGNSPYRGNIYVQWSDQRNGKDNTDIWFIRSEDGGESWSSPLKVNNDSTQTHQFMSWMTLDQVTGYIYIVYYDRSLYNNELTDVFLAVSRDGGRHFENYRISDKPFYPVESVFFGDYTNITAWNGVIVPIWTRLDTAVSSIVTAVLKDDHLKSLKDEMKTLSHEIFRVNPNPVHDALYLSFSVIHDTQLSLYVFDNKGNKVLTVFNGMPFQSGKYVYKLNIPTLHLKKGTYYVILFNGQNPLVRKIIVID